MRPVQTRAFVAALAAVAVLALAGAPVTQAEPAGNARGGMATAYAIAAAAEAISAPSTVDPGQQLTVTVRGAADGTRVEIWGPVDSGESASTLSSDDISGGTAEITAPSVPGSYELRHTGAGGGVISRQAFDVAAVPVSLTVPTEVNPGGTLEVVWRGRGSPGDTLQIVDPATGTTLESTPIAGSAETRNLSRLPVPGRTGRFEVRYVTGDGVVLRSVPFTVVTPGG